MIKSFELSEAKFVIRKIGYKSLKIPVAQRELYQTKRKRME